MKNKLENDFVFEWISKFDVVFISEMKQRLAYQVPGFKIIEATNEKSSRGGLAMLIKPHLFKDIKYMDNSLQEQIWFELKSVPDIVFGGVYVAPSESLYFRDSAFPEIQGKTTDSQKSFVFGGDMNSRCGKNVNDLISQSNGIIAEYTTSDAVVNSNGRNLLQVCSDNSLAILNGLQTDNRSFPSRLTFRRRKKWISDLDKCVISNDLIKGVETFLIDDDLRFPSDHAPISVSLLVPEITPSTADIYDEACNLGAHAVMSEGLCTMCTRAVPLHEIDSEAFVRAVQSHEPAVLEALHTGVPETAAAVFTEALQNSINDSRIVHNDERDVPKPDTNPGVPRWQRIMEMESEKTLWEAVGWNGEISDSYTEKEKPSDDEFQKHLESLLNPDSNEDVVELGDYNTTIPLLDDPIAMQELTDVVDKLKPRGAGPNGVKPAVYRWFPDSWLAVLLLLVNLVFLCGYPLSWSAAKLMMLFKKGKASDCNNYRGISIINSCAKVYDYVLNRRLMSWFHPCREQAGAQPKRGCMEHIVTLRLLISLCKRRRKKLFMTFVDFSKAYDRVPRGKMFHVLKTFGCGSVMLSAIIAMYKITTCILGSTSITASIGVRQGSPTSCFLFVMYVDMLIRLIKDNVGLDDFLEWVHTLMLMDDTIIFATSRARLLQKLYYLDKYCNEYGMVLNEKKTQLMVILGDEEDRQSIPLGTINIKHCDSYVYLGVVVTADGSTASSLKAHVKEKTKNLNKLIIFLTCNYDAPFFVKKKVFQAAFSASILYGMESWLGVSLKPVETLYMKGVKSLLGVRNSIPNDLCLIEAGILPLHSVVQNAQAKFFRRMIASRQEMEADPFGFTLRLIQRDDPTSWSHIQGVIAVTDHVKEGYTNLREAVSQKEGSRAAGYRDLNPELSTHYLYTQTSSYIPDNLRIAFTRLRLSSHRLRSETGRWSKTPREDRVCECGLLQDEKHILVCDRNLSIRQRYNFRASDGLQEVFTELDVRLLSMLKELTSNLEP